MSKQEAIEALERGILCAWRAGSAHIPRVELHEKLRAEALYDRIAPLIRGEFPEEKFRLVARRYRQARDEWFKQPPPMRGRIGYTFDQMIAGFKRFWEQDKPRGVCKTCGGRGEIPDDPEHPEGEWGLCPDCKGTREAQERKCFKFGASVAEYNLPCKHRYFDERSGGDRRILPQRIQTRRCYDNKISHSDGEWDDRTGRRLGVSDRRELPDRRKAVSDGAQGAR